MKVYDLKKTSVKHNVLNRLAFLRLFFPKNALSLQNFLPWYQILVHAVFSKPKFSIIQTR